MDPFVHKYDKREGEVEINATAEDLNLEEHNFNLFSRGEIYKSYVNFCFYCTEENVQVECFVYFKDDQTSVADGTCFTFCDKCMRGMDAFELIKHIIWTEDSIKQ